MIYELGKNSIANDLASCKSPNRPTTEKSIAQEEYKGAQIEQASTLSKISSEELRSSKTMASINPSATKNARTPETEM